MTFRDWLKRSFGRIVNGTKIHLIDIAKLLDIPAPVVDRMRSRPDEECESILLEQIESRHGGVVDWRARLVDILEAVDSCVTPEERKALHTNDGAVTTGFAEELHLLDSRLIPPMRALRAIESLGDAYIVVLVPRGKLSAFDQAARYWLV